MWVKIALASVPMAPSLAPRSCRGRRRACCRGSSADLRLQLFYAGVSALERLILNQRCLHQHVDCVRRSSQSVRD